MARGNYSNQVYNNNNNYINTNINTNVNNINNMNLKKPYS